MGRKMTVTAGDQVHRSARRHIKDPLSSPTVNQAHLKQLKVFRITGETRAVGLIRKEDLENPWFVPSKSLLNL